MKTRITTLGGFLAIITLGISGAFGSALYELARGGTDAAARGVLSLITLGSSAIKDGVYEEAALDPTAVPVLSWQRSICIMTLGALTGMLVVIAMGGRLRTRALRGIEHEAGDDLVTLRSKLERAKSRLVMVAWFLLGLMSLVWGNLFYQFLRCNQSILISRVFNGDLAICAPFIDEQREEELRSQFAQVKSKGDFLLVYSELQQIAESNDVRLCPYELW